MNVQFTGPASPTFVAYSLMIFDGYTTVSNIVNTSGYGNSLGTGSGVGVANIVFEATISLALQNGSTRNREPTGQHSCGTRHSDDTDGQLLPDGDSVRFFIAKRTGRKFARKAVRGPQNVHNNSRADQCGYDHQDFYP